MRDDRCLVVDVWEGQLEIDEAALKAGGVAGIGIRINDMNGGHHMDTGFAKQWKEAVGFVRFPYFVYNPWVDGAANYAWLEANMPDEARSVAIDIEVRYSGITPSKYAGEVNKFLALADKKWKTIIYTGAGYLDLLSKWPRVDYWWAQYPNPQTYFADVDTWQELTERLGNPALDVPFNVAQIPGTLKMWQVSGDYLTLPGCKRDIDVNVFYGSRAELARYFGSEPAGVDVPAAKEPVEILREAQDDALEYVVLANAVNVRRGPSVQSVRTGLVYKGERLLIKSVAEGYKQRWGEIEWNGRKAWVALEYFGQRLIEVG